MHTTVNKIIDHFILTTQGRLSVYHFKAMKDHIRIQGEIYGCAPINRKPMFGEQLKFTDKVFRVIN